MGKNPKLEIMVTILPKFKTSYEGVSSLHLKKKQRPLKSTLHTFALLVIYNSFPTIKTKAMI